MVVCVHLVGPNQRFHVDPAMLKGKLNKTFLLIYIYVHVS